ncbi:hypothetical protein MKEN_00606800 [Mycena kentingensis (nom. inval.)]|nr:hypothetical protein MKEN_00606800 [Mycena kentingensis (nom. inval.)]
MTVPRPLVAFVAFFSPPNEPRVETTCLLFQRLWQLALHTALFVVVVIAPDFSLPGNDRRRYAKYVYLPFLVTLQSGMSRLGLLHSVIAISLPMLYLTSFPDAVYPWDENAQPLTVVQTLACIPCAYFTFMLGVGFRNGPELYAPLGRLISVYPNAWRPQSSEDLGAPGVALK